MACFTRAKGNKRQRVAKGALFGVSNGNARRKGAFYDTKFRRFCDGTSLTLEENKSELILCELGKIPLALKRVALVYDGDPYTVVYPQIPSTNQIPIAMETLQYILAESKTGEVYYLDGNALRNLQIAENTLTYIDLKLLKNIPRNSTELLKEMGIRKSKKRKK